MNSDCSEFKSCEVFAEFKSCEVLTGLAKLIILNLIYKGKHDIRIETLAGANQRLLIYKVITVIF